MTARDTRHVHKALAKTAGGSLSSWLHASLPGALSDALPRRLRAAAFIYALIYGLNIVPPMIAMVAEDRPLNADAWVGLASIAIALSIGALSTPRRRRHVLAWLAATVFVVGAFGIVLGSVSPRFPDLAADPAYYRGIPWSCVWIVAFPMLVPTVPRWAVLGGLAATGASMLAVWAHLQIDPRLPPLPDVAWFGLLTSHVISVIFSVLGAMVVYRLGQDVTNAERRGSYELVRLLGVGGMGEVWLGRHAMLARPAAVKLIKPQALASTHPDVARARFEREAQVTARLQSPHSIEIYDFGVADDGSFYYVMEYLDGVDLETLVERYGPVEPARVIHWLRQACDSLAEAHARGLVHRDVKPANLYTCRRSLDVDVLKVLDFGLAKELASGSVELSATAQAVGTPGYLPPEMALGAETVDGRADLYGLGCVAYFLLTGELVFTGPTPLAVISQHLSADVVPPSTRVEMAVPADLEAIVMDCLAKAPEDRPASATDLAERLTACADAGGWTSARAQSWWASHRPEAAQTW